MSKRLLAALLPLVSVLALLLPSTALADWNIALTSMAGTSSNVSITDDGSTTTFEATGASATVARNDLLNELLVDDNDVRIVAESVTGGEAGNITALLFSAITTTNSLELVTGDAGTVDTSSDPLGSYGSVTVDGALEIGFSLTATVGDITVTGPITAAGGAAQLTAAGALDAQSTVEGGTLLVDAATISIDGSIGAGAMLNAVDLDATTSLSLGGAVVRANTIDIRDPFVLTGDMTIDGTTVNLAPIDGAHDLVVTSTFGTLSALGATTRLASLDVDWVTSLALSGASVRTTGLLDIATSQLAVAGDTTFDSASGDITLPSLGGPLVAHAVSVNSPGITTLTNLFSPFLSLTTDAPGTTRMAGGSVSAGSLVVNDTFAPTAAPSLTGASVQFNGGIDAPTVSINFGCSTGARVSAAVDVAALNATCPLTFADATIDTGNFGVSGSIILQGASSLSVPSTVSVTGNLNGPGSLVVTFPFAATTFQLGGRVGAGVPVDDLEMSVGELAITGSGGPVIQATGTISLGQLDLTGAATPTVNVNEALSIGALDLSGTTARLTAATKTIAGTVNGSAQIELNGGDTTWNVTTQSNATALTAVAGEHVTWSAGAPSRPITLQDGARLSGAGTVQTVTSTGPAIAAISPGTPGTPVGTLATGNLVGDNLLQLRIDSASAATDRVEVTGTPSLSGATLQIDTAGTAPVGTPRTILANDGVDAFLGTFSGLAEGAEVVGQDGSLHTVSYVGGDGNDVTITRVIRSTGTSIAQSAASSQTGAALTLTATVTTPTGTPTGSVTFTSGATTIGTAPVVAGVATFQTTTLAAGSYSFAATYDGSTSHATSTSTTVSHTRTPPPVPPTVDPTPDPDPDPTGPPALREPGLSLSSTCVVQQRAVPRYSFLASRNARVNYVLERRRSPTVVDTRRTCASDGARARMQFDRVAATSSNHDAGRIAGPIAAMLGERRLGPGIYRLSITIRPLTGGTPVTRSSTFTVVHR
jgi:hypothetical protein